MGVVILLMSNMKVSLLTHLLLLNLTCLLPHLFTRLLPHLFTSPLPYLFTSLLPLWSLLTSQLHPSLYLPFTSLLPHLFTTDPLFTPLLLLPDNTPTQSLPMKLQLRSPLVLPDLPVSNPIWKF